MRKLLIIIFLLSDATAFSQPRGLPWSAHYENGNFNEWNEGANTRGCIELIETNGVGGAPPVRPHGSGKKVARLEFTQACMNQMLAGGYRRPGFNITDDRRHSMT